MSSINVWCVSGNLGAEPEVKYAQSGTAVMRMRIAVNDRVKERGEWTDKTTWITGVVFGKRAEGLSKILDKGSKVFVRGRLQFREFEKRDGSNGYAIEIVADDVDVGSKGGGGGRRDGGGPVPQDAAPDPFEDGDDLPF